MIHERLDMILTFAAFEQSVSLLFIDDGVFQLLKNQQVIEQQLKDTASMYRALEIYEIDRIYVELESMERRGLQADSLIMPVLTLENRKVAELFSQCQVAFS